MKDINFLISNGVNINKSLELFGDIQTYNSTVGDFLLSINQKLEVLRRYKESKDMDNYAIYVHSLKSDASYFGFETLEKIAFEQEKRSKAKDVLYIDEHFNELITEVEKTVKIIKSYLNDEETTTAPNPISKGEVYTSQTILVVDDSNIIRNFVKRIFDGTYGVGTAKDGNEAIGIIESNKSNEQIVAILLDLNMPGVSGFEVLEYMKTNDLLSKIPVSIISGDSTKETIDKAFTYQIVDMLEKPFTENDIKRIVEKTIQYKNFN